MLHKILRGDIQIPIPDYVAAQQFYTRRTEDNAPILIPLDTNRDYYRYSFWPNTIFQWNVP